MRHEATTPKVFCRFPGVALVFTGADAEYLNDLYFFLPQGIYGTRFCRQDMPGSYRRMKDRVMKYLIVSLD